MKYRVELVAILVLFFAAFSAGAFAQTTCGNGLCDPGENQCTCPKDCGECSGDAAGLACKKLACVENLCKVVTKANCCGNASCEAGEIFSNCPADCAPKTLEVNILYPEEQDHFTRGEPLLARAEVLVDGQKTNFAVVKAKGIFGERELLNDGKHFDGTPFDYVFANAFEFPKDINDGKYSFSVSADFRGLKAEAEGVMEISSRLVFDGTRFPAETFQGTRLEVSGRTLARALPVQAKIGFVLSSGKTIVFEKSLESDANGSFSILYPISFVDPLGTYSYSLKAVDANANTGLLEGKIEVKQFGQQPLEIVFLNELAQEYKRGETLDLAVQVRKQGSSLLGARLELLLGGRKAGDFFEFEPGKYSVSVPIEDDTPEGTAGFTVRANVLEKNLAIEDYSDFSVFVVPGQIKLDVVEPEKSVFGVGETVQVRVKAFSPSLNQLVDARIVGRIGGKEVVLSPIGYGLFGAEYVVGEEDVGRNALSLKATDQFGNNGSTSVLLEFSPFGFVYFINKNLWIVAIVLAVVVIALPAAAKITGKKIRKRSLCSRERQLENALTQLQEKYFKRKSINKERYKKEFDELTSELLNARSELSNLDKK